MNIAEALKHGSVATHISGRASVRAFEDLGFSLLTVGDTTFVVQDLDDAIAINGVPRDEDQIRAFALRLIRETGISFAHGWKPNSRSQRNRGWVAGMVGMCLVLAYLIRHIWPR
jgi:hypothetical protein